MPRLPINTPFGLQGKLELNVDEGVLQVLNNNQRFPSSVAFGPGKLINVGVDLSGANAFKLGKSGDVAVSVGASAEASLDIVWPEEDPAALVPFDLDVPSDRLYLILNCAGQAEVGAAAKFPTGTLTGSLGLKTGVGTRFVQLRSFPRDRGSREIIQSFFERLRLPYNVTQSEELPEPGEVLAFEYSGYLALSAEMAWGYSVNQYIERSLGDLVLAQKIDIGLGATVKVGASMAGQFSIELRRAEREGNWARVVVRKQRQAAFDVAADLGVTIALDEEGLPDQLSQLVTSLLGVTVPQQVEQLLEVIEQGPDEALAWLGQKVNGFTQKVVQELFAKWYPHEQIAAKLQPFFEDLRKVVDTYEMLKRQDERLVQIATEYATNQIQEVRDDLAGLAERKGLAQVQKTLFWPMLRKLLGDRYFDFVTDDEAFAKLKGELVERLDTLLTGGIERLSDLTGVVKAVGKLDQIVAHIEKYDTPDELRAGAEKHVLLLAERLTGKAFDRLTSSAELQQALKELRGAIQKVDAFQKSAYARFKEALNQTYRINLSRSYTHATDRRALLDIEIDVEAEHGAQYLQEALHGNFAGVLEAAPASAALRLRKGAFTQQTTTTNRLNVSVFGWEYSRLHEVIRRAEETIVPRGNGLLHLYDFGFEEKDIRRKRGEEIQLSFTAGMLAEGFQAADTRPDLVEAVTRLSADYGFSITDPRTSDRELVTYLDLAKHLALLPPTVDPEEYVRLLRIQMDANPQEPLGQVDIVYRVSYAPDALLRAFQLMKPPSIKAITRRTFRRIISTTFANYGMRNVTTAEQSALSLSQAILSEGMRQEWRSKGLKTGVDGLVSFKMKNEMGKTITLTLNRMHRLVLEALFKVEEDLVDALVDLDQVLDVVDRNQGPSRKEVQRAFERFARQRRDVEQFMSIEERSRFVNPVFAILDDCIFSMQQANLLPADARQAVMELSVKQGDRALARVLLS